MKLFSLNYFMRVVKWLWQGKFYILSIGVVIVTFLYVFGVLNFYPNTVALLMIIVGLLIILRLLVLDARDFSEQRPNTIKNWIMSFPNMRSTGVAASSISAMLVGEKARVTVSLPENATIEKKVEFLLSQVKSVQDSIANVDMRVNNVETFLTKEVNDLKTNLRNIDSSLKSIIASHAVGTYDLNFFGIIITLCGTIIQYFS